MLRIIPRRVTPLAMLMSSVLALAACNENTAAPSAPSDDVSAAVTSATGDYIATPAGLYHRSCVHEIANGERVSRTGLVTHIDKSTSQTPPCRYAAHPTIRTLGMSFLAPPTDSGWIEYTQYQVPTGNSLHQITAGWRVPAAPTGSYSGTQTFYTFPGLEDINDPAPAPYIIQPVIQYGYNGYYGGSYWTAASWRCGRTSSTCFYGTPINISANDSIIGSVTASACASGSCTWTIATVDVTKGTRSNFVVTDLDTYNWSTGGAMEVYGLTSCNQFPSNGVFYSGIALKDKNGTTVTPTWTGIVQAAPSPSCGFSVSYTSSTTRLIVNPPPPPPPLSVSISGPSSVKPHASCTWIATAAGGTSPYGPYAWKANSTSIGNGTSELDYTVGTTGFTMSVDVTDHVASHATATKNITISSTAPACVQ